MTSTKEEIISFLEDLRKSGFSPIDETESICSYDEFCDEDSYSSCEVRPKKSYLFPVTLPLQDSIQKNPSRLPINVKHA